MALSVVRYLKCKFNMPWQVCQKGGVGFEVRKLVEGEALIAGSEGSQASHRNGALS